MYDLSWKKCIRIIEDDIYEHQIWYMWTPNISLQINEASQPRKGGDNTSEFDCKGQMVEHYKEL